MVLTTLAKDVAENIVEARGDETRGWETRLGVGAGERDGLPAKSAFVVPRLVA